MEGTGPRWGSRRRADRDAHPASSSPRASRPPGARRPRWSELAWLGILAAIGAVQVVRAQWFDAGLFFVAVAVLSVDACGLFPLGARRPPRPRLIAGATAVVGVALVLAPRHSPWMAVPMLLAAAAALIAAWPQTTPSARRPWSPGIRRLAVAWSIIVVVGCLWELLEFVLGRIEPTHSWFALSDLVDPLVGTLPGKIVFVAAWLGAGVFLVRRGRAS